jgi:hypothetical protein
VNTPTVTSPAVLNISAGNTEVQIQVAATSTQSVVLNTTSFGPFKAANGLLSSGRSDARWSCVYSGTGDFTGSVTSKTTSTSNVEHRVENSNGAVSLLTSTNKGLYDSTNGSWMIYTVKGETIPRIPQWASKGSSTQPVYFNANGQPATCTAYSGLLTEVTSSRSTNISVTVGGTTKSVNSAYATYACGTYTNNGGEQRPSYVGSGLVRWNMMRSTTTYFDKAAFSGYCDWMMMDTYTGSDVPYVTMIGVLKAATPHAYIASGSKGDSSGKWTINTLLDSSNSSITGDGGSTWGSSITIKINGTEKTLTIPSNPNTDTKVT